MANNRQRKKQEKRLLQQKAETAKIQSGISPKQARKEVQNYSYKTLNSIAQQEEKRQAQAKRRKVDKQNRRNRKRQSIEKLGLDPFQFTLKQIDSIKIKDIENGNVDKYSYPFLFGLDTFDFDKIYKLKNGERFFFAFRDFSGETSLESIIKMYDKMDEKNLLRNLEHLATMRPTYSKNGKGGGGNSSGAAGDYKFISGDQPTIEAMTRETRKDNRKKSKRKEHGAQTYKGYQVLKTGVRNSFNETTPRNMLVIMNAFMANVTEWDRVYFYRTMYRQLAKHMPDFASILPQPLDL